MNEKYDDDFIKSKYRAAIDRTVTKGDEDKIISLSEGRALKPKNNNVVKISHRLSKTAVAAIVIICVLLLGGGAVWAMTNSALKDYFFPKNNKSFDKVYTDVGREYEFGSFSVICSGAVYDSSVDKGYIQFDFFDMKGNPLDLQKELIHNNDICFDYEKIELTRKIISYGYTVAGSDVIFVFMDTDSLYATVDGASVLVKYAGNGDGNHSIQKSLKFMVLTGEEWDELCGEIYKLDIDELCKCSYDYTTIMTMYEYDRWSMQPEVVEILERYNPVEIKSLAPSPQIVEEDGLKITVGRTDLLFEYNIDECSVKSFTLKRKNGAKLIFKRNADETWDVTGLDKNKTFVSGARNRKDIRMDYTYGFILEPDEEVEVDIEKGIGDRYSHSADNYCWIKADDKLRLNYTADGVITRYWSKKPDDLDEWTLELLETKGDNF